MIHIGRRRGSAAAADGQAALHQVVVWRRRGLCHHHIRTCKQRRLPAALFFFTSLRFPTAGSSFLAPLCLFLPHLFFPSILVLLRLLALILATSRALLSAPHDAFSAWRAATWDPQLTEKLRNKRVFVFFPSVKASIALISSPCQTFGVQQLYVYYRAVCEQQI